jgi:hypothetical protein
MTSSEITIRFLLDFLLLLEVFSVVVVVVIVVGVVLFTVTLVASEWTQGNMVTLQTTIAVVNNTNPL